MLDWLKHKLESRLPVKYQKPQICKWHHPYGRKQRTKEPLDESKKGEWKSWLKTQHSKNKRSWHPVPSLHGNRWGNSGKSDRLYIRGLQNHCRWWQQHEIKRRLLLGRKAMINLDSVLKNRDVTLLTKVCLVKAMVFPVVMYACESCSIKKAEHQRIDGFELSFWKRLLRLPWTARRSNQSILKEISSGCSLEGLMLKLKL